MKSNSDKQPDKNPRGIVVAGLGGGSGKSIVAVGLTAALARQGQSVSPFKKGPDYIDAGWLSLAAGRPCYNLDPYLMTEADILASMAAHARSADIVLVEGNRGLYDGVDADGTFSTAELARILQLPVVLVVDCTKVTRTIAALVLGCREFDRGCDIRGVILNRIARSRHESIVRQSVEQYTGIPVIGAIPKLKQDVFPQRHLGVTPFQEHDGARDAILALAKTIEDTVDLTRTVELMATMALPSGTTSPEPARIAAKDRVRIGVIRDAAFQFYYAENLEALEREGAELVEINALSEPGLPDIYGLYIGGGFPETSAGMLSANVSFRDSVRQQADNGMPIYAECGGLIFLGESLEVDGAVYPLAGVFPVRFGMAAKPQAHGYSTLEAVKANPFYRINSEIRGHEFRYSTVLAWPGNPDDLVFRVKRGTGFVDGRDGLHYKNVLALYTHIHATATPEWAKALTARAREWKRQAG